MTELIADIIAVWQANTTLDDIAGPWLGMAPDGAAYPYAVMQFVGGGAEEYHFDRTLVEKPTVRITIYHTTLADLLTYHRAMENQFLQREIADTAQAANTDVKFVKCKRGPAKPMVGALPKPDAPGNTVYFAASTYEFYTQRTLPTS